MNDDKQKVLNIFDDNIKLQNPINREKQEQIEQLIKETFKIEGNTNDNNETK